MDMQAPHKAMLSPGLVHRSLHSLLPPGIVHLQLGLELLHLLLQVLNSLRPLAASGADIHGGLAGEGVAGAGTPQHPNLAGALPAQARGAEGYPH